MSTFPAAIDTDATLYVAKDNIQTTLSVQQNPSDTVAIVASTTGWAANMIATIDNEQELVTGVTGTNTLQVTRNFNGTGAVAHSAGRKVSNFVDAAYHSAVSSAIQAIEGTLLGSITMPGGISFRTTNGKYQWSFNNLAQDVAIFSQFGQKTGPYVTANPPNAPGPGDGEYHIYYHSAGNSGPGAGGASAIFQTYMEAGTGGTLSAVWADATYEGSWVPQPPYGGGITNGPIGGTFSATLAHSTGYGGFILSLNTYATCNGPSPAQGMAGMEVDIANHVAGTGGHSGIMVVDQSTQPTNQSNDFGYGLNGQPGSPGFLHGFQVDAAAVASNGTMFFATCSCQNGIDLSACTFGGLVLNLPGFVLGNGGNIESPITIQPSGAGAINLTLTSGIKTSGPMLSLNHSGSTWTGNGLSMNFGTGGGLYSGDFIACFINGALKFGVDQNGAIVAAGLPNANPGAGSKALWYDPADSNRVKYAP